MGPGVDQSIKPWGLWGLSCSPILPWILERQIESETNEMRHFCVSVASGEARDQKVRKQVRYIAKIFEALIEITDWQALCGRLGESRLQADEEV